MKVAQGQPKAAEGEKEKSEGAEAIHAKHSTVLDFAIGSYIEGLAGLLGRARAAQYVRSVLTQSGIGVIRDLTPLPDKEIAHAVNLILSIPRQTRAEVLKHAKEIINGALRIDLAMQGIFRFF